VLNRWVKPGQITNIQRFTATSGPALTNASRLSSSDAIFSNASFIRCKNISLAYNFPQKWMPRLHFENIKIYFHARNVFTITNYIGSDPENQSILVLPPLKTFTVGIAANF
jgi:hypothetical protein